MLHMCMHPHVLTPAGMHTHPHVWMHEHMCVLTRVHAPLHMCMHTHKYASENHRVRTRLLPSSWAPFSKPTLAFAWTSATRRRGAHEAARVSAEPEVGGFL